MENKIQSCQNNNLGYVCVYKDDKLMIYPPSDICNISNIDIFKKSSKLAGEVKDAFLWYNVVKWIFIALLALSIGFVLYITFFIGWVALVPALFVIAVIALILTLVFGLALIGLNKSAKQKMVAKCEGGLRTYAIEYAANTEYNKNFDSDFYQKTGSPNAKDLISIIKSSGMLSDDIKIPVVNVRSIIQEYEGRIEEAKKWAFITGMGTRSAIEGTTNIAGGILSGLGRNRGLH